MSEIENTVKQSIRYGTWFILAIAFIEWILYIATVTWSGGWYGPLANYHTLVVALGLAGILVFLFMSLKFGLEILLIIPNTVHLFAGRRIPIDIWTEASCRGLTHYHVLCLIGVCAWIVHRLAHNWFAYSKQIFWLVIIGLLVVLLFRLVRQWRLVLSEYSQQED
jgi:hypothetical protein